MSDFMSNAIPGSPYLSYLILWAVLMVGLYLARERAHEVIRAGSMVVRNAMRLAASSVGLAEKRLIARNREVLLAAGEAEAERQLEREFHRISAHVDRSLQNYPSIQRTVSEQITRIEEDFNATSHVPPTPPTWASAVKAVAKIPDQDNTLVASILGDIHRTLVAQEKKVTEEYRAETGKRHRILANMLPYWRAILSRLDEMDKSVPEMQSRARLIDGLMATYEDIRNGSDRAVRKLSSSSMTQFVTAGTVLAIAIGGAMINFNLIALPMSEMVGGGSYIGHFKTSDVAALVIILVEAAMGLFLMECLRITRLFPLIGSLDDRVRRRMMWIAFSILFILAGIESSLAFMRDRIAADIQALRQSLAGSQPGDVTPSLIPTVGQMVMGFILPFALTFVAIPLESFIHASRTVAGVATAGLLRVTAFYLRFLGTTAYYLGSLTTALYDLFIFPSLWLEGVVGKKGRPSISIPSSRKGGGHGGTVSSQGSSSEASFAPRPAMTEEEVISE